MTEWAGSRLLEHVPESSTDTIAARLSQYRFVLVSVLTGCKDRLLCHNMNVIENNQQLA
jgi:hypothetical protein